MGSTHLLIKASYFFRASHPEALKWAEVMLDETKDVETKKELFKAAIVKQTQVMKENIFGEGVDIPLLGIKNACQEIWPEQNFELFEDATFSNAMKFKLSTSQVKYIISSITTIILGIMVDP